MTKCAMCLSKILGDEIGIYATRCCNMVYHYECGIPKCSCVEKFRRGILVRMMGIAISSMLFGFYLSCHKIVMQEHRIRAQERQIHALERDMKHQTRKLSDRISATAIRTDKSMEVALTALREASKTALRK